MNQTLFVVGHLSIKDYKRPLQKGLVYCPYLFGSGESTDFVDVDWCEYAIERCRQAMCDVGFRSLPECINFVDDHYKN